MNLTIVIPYYNEKEALKRLIKTIPQELQIIVVNDQSEIPPEVSGDNVRLLNLKNKGYFSGAVNAGIKACNNDVLILNQDTRLVGTGALDLLADNSDKYAMIGERISGNHPAWSNGYIHGTYMFMRRDAIEKVGLLDTKYYPLWGSTCEWQLRACRKNFKVLPVHEIPGFLHDRNGGMGNSIQSLLKKEPGKRDILIRTPPLISVIAPSYRHGEYAQDLINSLIGGNTSLGYMEGQTLQSFEIIIADDCSDDGSYERMKDLADPWKGIHIIQTKENGGTSVACNTAIRAAKASVIARIDGDDMRESDSLELMYDTLVENPKSFIYDDVILFTNGKRLENIWRIKEYGFDELIKKNRVHAGIMFKKKAWAEVGGYPEEMRYGRDDWAFNVGMEIKGYCGVHSHSTGYLYRRDGQNRTLRNTTPQWRSQFAEQLKKLYPDVYRGERPMGCCGNRNRIPVTRAGASPTAQGGTYSMPTNNPGATGTVILEYQGANYGNETYIGPITMTPYIFSVKKNRRRVDERDLHFVSMQGQGLGLLDLRMPGGKPLFTRVMPAPPKPAPAPEVEVEEIKVEVLVSNQPEPEEVVSFEMISQEEVIHEDLTAISGIGPATAKKLNNAGIYSVADFLNTDNSKLMDILGWSQSKLDKAFDSL